MSNENEFFDVSSLSTNEDLEVQGVWRDLPKGAAIRVARWQNTEFSRMMRLRFKANRDLIDGDDDLSDKVSLDILIEVMAATILKDVRNFGLEGKRIEKYTPEIGEKLLRVKDFREKVKAVSEQADQYRLKQEDKAVNA
jgi:hypothetical protein